MIFQDPYSSLNPRKTRRLDHRRPVRDPPPAHGPGERKKQVQELMDRVGLNPEHYNRYPHEFSGGQRQRIGVARALALRPKLIIADEPVSALDVSIQAQILNLLRELQREFGLTMIFIAHDLAVVRHMCDRVAVMYLGKVVEVAPSDTLYALPRHRYTGALLSAVPVADPELAHRERRLLGGDVPSPANPPSGCRFHPRCASAGPVCSTEEPTLTDMGQEPAPPATSRSPTTRSGTSCRSLGKGLERDPPSAVAGSTASRYDGPRGLSPRRGRPAGAGDARARSRLVGQPHGEARAADRERQGRQGGGAAAVEHRVEGARGALQRAVCSWIEGRPLGARRLRDRGRTEMKLDGLNHITAITGDAPRNVDFYTRTLGLRLVTKTVNQDDPTVYHLFYADEHGSPGADLTFFEYPGAARGQLGAGCAYRVLSRVGSADSLAFWSERLAGHGVALEQDLDSVRFADPEGLEHELVVEDVPDEPLRAEHPEIPPEHALLGFAGVHAYSMRPQASRELLEDVLGAVALDDQTLRAARRAPRREDHLRRRAGRPPAPGGRLDPPHRLGHDRRRAPALARARERLRGAKHPHNRPPLLPLDLLPRTRRHPV